MVGSGKAAENGIIFKNSESLEMLSKVDVFIFDKTGTLTLGKPTVTDILGDKETLKYAAIAEKKSEHPIAKAVVEHAKNVYKIIEEPTKFKAVSGMGVIAVCRKRKHIFLET
jgi:Cu+-exporting ATPase